MVAEKWKNAVWTCQARCKGSHGERLAQLVCELARVVIINGWSMNIAAFSTWICEAGYQANEEPVVSRMFFREL